MGPIFVSTYSKAVFSSHGHLPTSLQEIINNGLMTLFFLLISLEIKRELLIGELNTRKKAMLPVIAALGGMIAPALIYVGININYPQYLSGWAIPAATDIAFSLAILTLLGSRIPSALKTFLLALALIDDLGAIIIIAVFYTNHVELWWLLPGLVCFLIFMVLFCLLRRSCNPGWRYCGTNYTAEILKKVVATQEYRKAVTPLGCLWHITFICSGKCWFPFLGFHSKNFI